MKKFRKIHLRILVALLGIAAAYFWLFDGESAYGGRSLRYWLKGSSPFSIGGHVVTDFTPWPAVLENDAKHAIRQIGTNALPALTEMIRGKESTVKRTIRSFLARQSFLKFKLDSPKVWQERAMAAFGELGRAGVPTLIELLKEPSNGPVLLKILPRIPDPRAVPAIIEYLYEADGRVRTNVASPLMHQGPLGATPGEMLNIAILGDGFFEVVTPDGQMTFTRNGAFQLALDGRWITAEGYAPLSGFQPIPPGTKILVISEDGAVLIGVPNGITSFQLQLTRFNNPSKLETIEQGYFRQTKASGRPEVGNPGENGFGFLIQGFLEALP